MECEGGVFVGVAIMLLIEALILLPILAIWYGA